MTLDELADRLGRVAQDESRHPDQDLGILVCEHALAAAQAENYGVGALLVDSGGTVIERGQNQVFAPRFRSDLHAEMIVITAFEERYPESASMRGYTMITSLEPCPMCLGRLLMAGVQTIKFLAADELGGMVTHISSLPQAWQRLASRQEYVLADVSDELRQLALDLFLANLDRLRRKLWAR